MMSAKSPIICRCEYNGVKRSNRKALRLFPYGRNESCLNVLDITGLSNTQF